MAKKALLAALGLFVGFIFACLLVLLVEGFSNLVHPYPPDFKGTSEEIRRQVETYPHWVLGVVTLLWGAIISRSVWLAVRIGGRISGVLLGLLLLGALTYNVSQLPYPLWFKIAEFATFPLFFLAGLFPIRSWLAGRSKTAGR